MTCMLHKLIKKNPNKTHYCERKTNISAVKVTILYVFIKWKESVLYNG